MARFVPLVLATVLLAQRTLSAVLAKVGHPGAALDDAYIHFQYARAFAEGHPFRFQAGEPISTGATSFLWPAILAPFYAVGFRGESILWPTWALSFVALGALAYEAYALTIPLAGRPAAIGAGGMVLGFGGFCWCAASGMEVVPFAWLLAFAIRRAAEWSENEERRTRRSLTALLVLAVLLPLMRPEGALFSVAIGSVVAVFPRRWRAANVAATPSPLTRFEALAFIAAALSPNLLLLLLTGSPTSSTTQVKLIPYSPYLSLGESAVANARALVGTILDGQVWSAEFLPKGGAALAMVGLAAIVWRGQASGLRVRAGLSLLLALAMFVPCVYVTFLWNRLRYLWPFATGWFIGLACLARSTAILVRLIDRRAGAATSALLAGGFAGALAVRLDWVIEDIAQSASGIDRQQAELGRWAKANLPAGTRIGVNDTGAIAYFGDRRTFDVVGLTTASEGRYWVAGSGSRLEHYERIHAIAPASLPTHFIVYPEWMACEPILGATLHFSTVTDATILGGQTMKVMTARWDHLGTGEAPWTDLKTTTDVLDVADIESEAAHDYQLLGAREGEQTTYEGNAPSGAVVLDGGRTNRVHERFFAKLPAEGRRIGVARIDASGSLLRVRIAGEELPPVATEVGPWTEVSFDVPPATRGDRVEIEVFSDAPLTSFHYWFGAL